MYPSSNSFQMPKSDPRPMLLALQFVDEESSALLRIALRRYAIERGPAFFRKFENAVKFFADILKQNLEWN